MESPAMLTACHRYIEERVFPLMYMIDDEHAVVQGTGFLLEDTKKLYLITAKHVLDEDRGIRYAQIAFPIFGPGKEMWTLPHAPYTSREETNADFAVVPLNYPSPIIDRLHWKTFGFDSFYKRNVVYDDQAIFVHGFPVGLQHDQRGNPFVNIGVISFTTSMYKGDLS